MNKEEEAEDEGEAVVLLCGFASRTHQKKKCNRLLDFFFFRVQAAAMRRAAIAMC